MTVRSCFTALWQIRSVCRFLSQHALLTLIRALVVSKVDYCISALVCITGYLMVKLQSVLNAAARLVFSARKSEHITRLLREVYWLRVSERIQFRLCVLVHHCLHGSAPSDHRSERPSLPAVRQQLVVDYTIRTAFDPRRSGIPCGIVQGREQSAQLNEEHRVIAKFSPETQNIVLPVVV